MYYNRLRVTQNADTKTIRDAYFERYKTADEDSKTLINKAKSCLTDDASRTAYNKALAKYGIKDGEAGGFVEITSQNISTAADGAEAQFEVTFGDDMTECMATDLESLKQEASEGLDIAKGTFNIIYIHKGKRVVVRTQGNYKIMVNKPPNADGNFEVICELIDDKLEALPVVEEKKLLS